jgi:alpha-methylacyl-CoA racemase
MAARGTFLDVAGTSEPQPAPRFSRTPGAVRGRPRRAGEDTVDVLSAWGFADGELSKLLETGAVLQAPPAGDQPAV